MLTLEALRQVLDEADGFLDEVIEVMVDARVFMDNCEISSDRPLDDLVELLDIAKEHHEACSHATKILNLTVLRLLYANQCNLDRQARYGKMHNPIVFELRIERIAKRGKAVGDELSKLLGNRFPDIYQRINKASDDQRPEITCQPS